MQRPAIHRRGMTLIEIVVVVMILGILASIAMPWVLTAAGAATDNSLRHTLEVIRGAIDRYTVDHEDALPGADGQQQTFKNDLAAYLRGTEFPVCPVGAGNNQVHLFSGGGAVATQIDATSGTHAWLYNFTTGEFYVNSKDTTADGTTTYDQF